VRVRRQVWVPIGELLASPTRALHGWAPMAPPAGAKHREAGKIRLHIELEAAGVRASRTRARNARRAFTHAARTRARQRSAGWPGVRPRPAG
jgi:hypothetical protein